MLLLSPGLAQASGPIQVNDNFESGSLGTWRIEHETTLVISPRMEYDQDHVNSAMTWFYGRLSNVLDREVTVRMEGLDYTVYNGQKGNILPYERNTRPVYSYDGAAWERFTDCSFQKDSKTFTIRQIFSRESVWIAYIPPYTFSRLESLLSEIRNSPGVVVDSVGKSVEGRPIYLVHVTDHSRSDLDRPLAWIAARQHAFEAGGSWAVEGMIRFLVSDDPVARNLRSRVQFVICPMLNPDGVARGSTRFNARGIDLNRHWHAADPISTNAEMAPEIVLVKKALRKWRAAHHLDLWINIHNNDMVWNDDGDYIRFAPEARLEDARRLEKILREDTIFTGPFEPAPNAAATESVVAAEFGGLGLVMEMKTGFLEKADRWTDIDLFLAHGRGLARAIGDFFASPENASPR